MFRADNVDLISISPVRLLSEILNWNRNLMANLFHCTTGYGDYQSGHSQTPVSSSSTCSGQYKSMLRFIALEWTHLQPLWGILS
ncbi:hypothetical protein E2562_035585 [Oryza meyeriana var. granulata]|uniref:Uncharacterized protein n=1 Tax=Oryza meyeriana var. granulata TaxID=110450 RepID=A0A6G1CB77_9ORYZ|nr:hypothetical protein E2562_035585 [Oryza meyeriana var. granulata]